MRKIIVQEWISLDGFAEDKEGKIDFFTSVSSEANKYSDEDQLKFMEDVDIILLGRKTYELFADFWPDATSAEEVIADRLNATKKIIFSNTIKQAPWGKWPAAQIIKGEATDHIHQLKKTNGKNVVLWGSISLAQSLMKHHLIDEYHLQICPVILGAGKPLFPQMHRHINLELFEIKHYETGVAFLKYKTVTR